MPIRLFPSPTEDCCTPYVQCADTKTFLRLANMGKGVGAVRLDMCDETAAAVSPLNNSHPVAKYRLPNRQSVIQYLRKQDEVCKPLLCYANEFQIIPAFSLSKEEAIIKAVVRQVIRASQAKKLISNFIKELGESDGPLFGFPALSMLARVSTHEYQKLGLGMKAERISSIVTKLLINSKLIYRDLHGIGPWTEAVLQVDLSHDYRHYPFEDKSGSKISDLFGIHLDSVSRKHKLLAADLYVYAASYMECTK